MRVALVFASERGPGGADIARAILGRFDWIQTIERTTIPGMDALIEGSKVVTAIAAGEHRWDDRAITADDAGFIADQLIRMREFLKGLKGQASRSPDQAQIAADLGAAAVLVENAAFELRYWKVTIDEKR